MTRRSWLLCVAVLLVSACARHVVVEREAVDSLNDRAWLIESRPPAAPVERPPAAVSDEPSPDLEERLLRLERLRRDGLISEEEYRAKHSELVDQL